MRIRIDNRRTNDIGYDANFYGWWTFVEVFLLIVLHQSNLTRETELTQVERKDGRETTASCFRCCRKSRWRSSRLHFLLIQSSRGGLFSFFSELSGAELKKGWRLVLAWSEHRIWTVRILKKNIASWSRDCQRRKGSVWETMVEHVHHQAEVVG